MKTRAIRIHDYGGPEVLSWEEVELPDPAGGATVRIGQQYALRDAATAQRDLEARKTTGSTILLP